MKQSNVALHGNISLTLEQVQEEEGSEPSIGDLHHAKETIVKFNEAAFHPPSIIAPRDIMKPARKN